jgi:hypothetical protein
MYVKQVNSNMQSVYLTPRHCKYLKLVRNYKIELHIFKDYKATVSKKKAFFRKIFK